MILIFLLLWPEKVTRGNSAAEKPFTFINLMLLTKCSMLTVKNDDKRKIAFFYIISGRVKMYFMTTSFTFKVSHLAQNSRSN